MPARTYNAGRIRLLLIRLGVLHRADGGLFDPNLYVRINLQEHGRRVDLHNLSVNATQGHDTVTLARTFNELLTLILFFLLRTDNEEIEDEENEN